METRRERLMQARAHRIQHAPERPTLAQLREEERALEQSVIGLVRHVQDRQRYGKREQRLEQRRESCNWQGELAAERVLAAGKAHGPPRDRQAEQMVAKLERQDRLHAAVQQLQGLRTRWGTTSRSRVLPCGSSFSSGRRNASATRG